VLRRRFGASVIALLLAVLLWDAGADVAGADACFGSATVASDDATRLEAKRAVLCLVNGIRSTRGLNRLRVQRQLAVAAVAHSRDMVVRKYFGHTGPAGDDLGSRLRRSGYFESHPRSAANEAIAWGTEASARVLVDALMASPDHRSMVLNPSARQIGLGMTLGAPANGVDDAAATLVLDFGQ
jgi:uncharacterized protein YkwD